jgi:NitT/TauT family transport system ATP-binding protein
MMLRLDHVGRRFGGVEALRDVSFGLDRGAFVALLGPSGCGKSSLLRLIAGLDVPDAGSIAWDGGALPPGQIGFVFQDPTLLPWFDARDNVALPLRLAGMPKRQARAVAEEALARVGLAGAARRLPRALSGGMRMRVSLARALAQRPQILLMDEPFAALDEFTRHGLQEDLRLLWRESGVSILFVTHSIDEACFLAPCVLLMRSHPGRIADDLVSPAPMAAREDAARLGFVADLARRLAAMAGEES